MCYSNPTEECQEIGCKASEKECGDLGAGAFAGTNLVEIIVSNLKDCAARCLICLLWFEDAS